jgi:hypothetical protein
MVIFHSYGTVYQRVPISIIPVIHFFRKAPGSWSSSESVELPGSEVHTILGIAFRCWDRHGTDFSPGFAVGFGWEMSLKGHPNTDVWNMMKQNHHLGTGWIRTSTKKMAIQWGHSDSPAMMFRIHQWIYPDPYSSIFTSIISNSTSATTRYDHQPRLTWTLLRCSDTLGQWHSATSGWQVSDVTNTGVFRFRKSGLKMSQADFQKFIDVFLMQITLPGPKRRSLASVVFEKYCSNNLFFLTYIYIYKSNTKVNR